MSYYRECPYCHAHLDPGETCDCQAENPSDEDPDEDPEERVFSDD